MSSRHRVCMCSDRHTATDCCYFQITCGRISVLIGFCSISLTNITMLLTIVSYIRCPRCCCAAVYCDTHSQVHVYNVMYADWWLRKAKECRSPWQPATSYSGFSFSQWSRWNTVTKLSKYAVRKASFSWFSFLVIGSIANEQRKKRKMPFLFAA